MLKSLRLIIINDIHYSGAAWKEGVPEYRGSPLGLEFLRRIRHRLEKTPDRADAVILAGDILNNGYNKAGAADLRRVKKELDRFGPPGIAIPGNHDGDYRTFFSVFDDKPGPHPLKNFLLYTFADTYLPGDYCARTKRNLANFEQISAAHPGKKIIVFQHNPVWPPVHPSVPTTYPYNLANADEVTSCYARRRVTLSVSGHYHPGQPPAYKNGVAYLTVPALCEPPFSYAFVEIGRQGKIAVTIKTLRKKML